MQTVQFSPDILDSVNPVVVEKAADILERGWQRNEYSNACGTRHCAMGALYAALAGDPNWTFDFKNYNIPYGSWAYENALETVLAAEGKGDFIVEWNDAQRDKRKVVRFFRRTARALRLAQAQRRFAA